MNDSKKSLPEGMKNPRKSLPHVSPGKRTLLWLGRLLLLLLFYFGPCMQPLAKQISYSSFKKHVSKGNVSLITVQDDEISGIFKETMELGQGLPPFDHQTLQIDDLPIFIAGDVNSYRPVLHEASHEGAVAGHNVLQENPIQFKRKTHLAIAFSDPNICAVGAAWEEIKDKQPAIGAAHFDGSRETIMLRDQGIVRVYGDSKSGRLLGAEMVAPGGEHLAHLLAWSIQQERTVFDLLTMPFYHPTVEETLRKALEDLASDVQGGGESPLVGFEMV